MLNVVFMNAAFIDIVLPAEDSGSRQTPTPQPNRTFYSEVLKGSAPGNFGAS